MSYVPGFVDRTRQEKTCARAICEEPRRGGAGENRYCSGECATTSRLMDEPRPALEEWTWLPLAPREVRVPGTRNTGDGSGD